MTKHSVYPFGIDPTTINRVDMDMRKDYAIHRAIETVADSLHSRVTFVSYERFNNCYHEAKEANIEWLEALLKKLVSIGDGNYPAIGFLSHVGRLVKEYTESYLPGYDTLVYLAYMDSFVADGTLAEELTPKQFDDYIVSIIPLKEDN